MPVQFPNYGSLPYVKPEYVKPDYSGIVNFIPEALKTAQAVSESVENPYKQRHERMMNEQKLQEQMMKNALEKEFGHRSREADIASKTAYARNLLNPMTSTQKDLSSIYGEGTPEFQEAMKQQYNLRDSSQGMQDRNIAVAEGVPESIVGRSLKNLGTNERLRETTRMREDLDKSIAKQKVVESAKTIKEISKKFPNLWKSMTMVLRNPMNDKEFTNFIKSKGVNEKEAEALDIMNKVSGELAFDMGTSLGARNFTDAKLKGIEAIKPNAKMTPGAISALADRLIHENEIGEMEEKAYRYGINNEYSILPNPKEFRKALKEQRDAIQGSTTTLGIPSDAETMSRGAQDFGMSRGKIYTIDDPRVQATAKNRNMAPEDVVLLLNKARYQ